MVTLLGKLNLLIGDLLLNSFQESITVKRGHRLDLETDFLRDPNSEERLQVPLRADVLLSVQEPLSGKRKEL